MIIFPTTSPSCHAAAQLSDILVFRCYLMLIICTDRKQALCPVKVWITLYQYVRNYTSSSAIAQSFLTFSIKNCYLTACLIDCFEKILIQGVSIHYSTHLFNLYCGNSSCNFKLWLMNKRSKMVQTTVNMWRTSTLLLKKKIHTFTSLMLIISGRVEIQWWNILNSLCLLDSERP